MKKYVVIPHNSIGPIKLGMSKKSVREIFGKPYFSNDSYTKFNINFPAKDYYFNNAFQINYDKNENVEFIEVSSHKDYQIILDEISIFDNSPEKILNLLKKHDLPDENNSEYPLNIIFKNLDLTLYREHNENEKFDAIGIGIKGYIN